MPHLVICNHAATCGLNDCEHAQPHECENIGYAMECIAIDEVVQCLAPTQEQL